MFVGCTRYPDFQNDVVISKTVIENGVCSYGYSREFLTVDLYAPCECLDVGDSLNILIKKGIRK